MLACKFLLKQDVHKNIKLLLNEKNEFMFLLTFSQYVPQIVNKFRT